MNKQLDLFTNYEKEQQEYKKAALQLIKAASRDHSVRMRDVVIKQPAARPAKISHEKIQSKKELERDERYADE
jgi:hypothetical protein